MNFRKAILTAALRAKITKKQQAALQDAYDNAAKHPFLWKAMEAVVKRRYYLSTGKVIGAGFDWSTILDWLIANLPMLISLLLSLIGG